MLLTFVASSVLPKLAGVLGMACVVAIACSVANAEVTDGKTLRHVVLFQFKEGTAPADLERIVESFRGLPAKIKEIADFEWGTDVSPEGKADGFTHCFLVTFRTEADRDVYLPHPAHQEFVKVVGPHVEKVCVVDFWSRD